MAHTTSDLHRNEMQGCHGSTVTHVQDLFKRGIDPNFRYCTKLKLIMPAAVTVVLRSDQFWLQGLVTTCILDGY